jgi:hypothetical protein
MATRTPHPESTSDRRLLSQECDNQSDCQLTVLFFLLAGRAVTSALLMGGGCWMTASMAVATAHGCGHAHHHGDAHNAHDHGVGATTASRHRQVTTTSASHRALADYDDDDVLPGKTIGSENDDGVSEVCGTKTPPAADRARVAKLLEAYEKSNSSARKVMVNIPVSFQIITDGTKGAVSDATVTAQIAVMNAAFNPLNFNFVLRETVRTNNALMYDACLNDPFGKEELYKAPLRKPGDRLDVLYFYTCDLPPGILGYAQFPSFGRLNTDSIVCTVNTLPGGALERYSEGDTGIHEVGTLVYFKERKTIVMSADGCYTFRCVSLYDALYMIAKQHGLD